MNQLLVQPFVNYKPTSSPILTPDWARRANQQWTAPVRGGKLWRVGLVGLPVNTQIQVCSNAERPDFAADWTLRVIGGKIGPAHTNDTAYYFFAPNVGLVAMISQEDVEAFWIIHIDSSSGKVLAGS